MESLIFLQTATPILLPLIFIFIIFRHRLSSKKTKKFPPSPPRLPIIGNLHQIGRLPHQSLQSLSQKYGDVMLLHFGCRPALVVSSPEAASLVLKTHDAAFCSKPSWSMFTRILYDGKGVIAAPYGEYWRHMRGICVNQLLSKTKVLSFATVMQEEVAHMVDNIKSKILASSSSSSSAVINMREMFMLVTNGLICRVAIGIRYSGNKDEDYGINVEEVMAETVRLIGRFSVGDFVPWLAWIDRLIGDSAKVEKLIKILDDFLERVLEKHREKAKGDDEKDFADVLLELQKDGDVSGYMGIEDIKALLLDMYLAGTDTSSTTLEWMMSEILVNPQVKQKLQEEVKEESKGKNVITEEDLKNMVYLKAVVQETLRLHPPATLLLPRESIQDVKINGYDIESGTLVFVNNWAIGRDPRNWDEPERFFPERFLTKSRSRDVEFGMIPFGSGRRGCPGKSFAIVTLELAMANLLLQFEWRLRFGAEKERLGMEEYPGITTRRKTPLLAVATVRPLIPIVMMKERDGRISAAGKSYSRNLQHAAIGFFVDSKVKHT